MRDGSEDDWEKKWKGMGKRKERKVRGDRREERWEE
jgi:hypothetical protein